MRDNLDGDLLRLFEEKNLELPEEPFRFELRLRIEKARGGYRYAYWILTVFALAACSMLTTFVIDAVTLLCGELTGAMQIVGEFLATPAGLAAAAAIALISLAFNRRVLSMIA